MKKSFYILGIFFSLLSSKVAAQYQIGNTVLSFRLPNIQNDSIFHLDDYRNVPCVVIIFDAIDCAYSEHYKERIININKEFESRGVKFILINSNIPKLSPKDSKTEMKIHYKEHQFAFPYLADKTGHVAEIFGATKTPECYVLKTYNKKFTLMYKGNIDDNALTATDVTDYYLKDVLESILNGKKPKIESTSPTGCAIKN